MHPSPQGAGAPTFTDPFWQAALQECLHAAAEAECVLVPERFLPHHERFAPLEFSWGLRDVERLAWCCSKDDVDRLAPWLLDDAVRYRWSNEVFVCGATFESARVPDADSHRHLAAWLDRVRRYRGGHPARPARERLPGNGFASPARGGGHIKVLVVGASGMGNLGDDLLADVIASMLADGGADVRLSGPDIDPLHVAGYDAVVVGGGGLIYASRDGEIETQNLANYLKFGPIGRHLDIPVALVGIGDQDHAHGLEANEITLRFARRALAQFNCVTTRDEPSTELLGRLGAPDARTGSDLLFHWLERARRAVRPTAPPPGRIALAGEFYRHRSFALGLGDGTGRLGLAACEGDYDILVMSDDDLRHAARLQNALQETGASVTTVDIRDRSFEALIFLFASYAGIVTTRFHGLVLAALARTPVLALDVPEGKKARLLRALGAEGSLLLEGGDVDRAIERLGEALGGRLDALPVEGVQELGLAANVHRRALHELLGRGFSEYALVGRHPRPAAGTRTRDESVDSVPLCWAASTPATRGYANLGDSLSAVMVAALAGRPVRHVDFDEATTKLVAVGSIGHAIRNGTAVVWGTGVSVRGGILAQNVPLTRYDVRAIRGPISAQHFRDFGIAVPDVFGDPVWLLPSIVHDPVEPRYELGIVPHIREIASPHPDAPPRADSLRYVVDDAEKRGIALINTWHESTWEGLLAKIRLIRSCRRIVSQSFHGLVIAEAYGIPTLNIRHMPGLPNGAMHIDLRQACSTDPRVWEFYKSGDLAGFWMYNQRRDGRTDWDALIRAIDARWVPFRFDAAPLVDAFPLPLAYQPLTEHLSDTRHIEAIRF